LLILLTFNILLIGPSMNPSLQYQAIEPLFNLLRQEISEYGALICLLNEQQKLIFFRDALGLVDTNKLIEKQIGFISDLQAKRYGLIEGLKSSSTKSIHKVEDFLELCPAPLRNLLKDLIDNLILLTQKISDKNKQNSLYLEKALKENQSLFKKLVSQAHVATYNKKGNLSLSSTKVRANN
jgi:flagellar biosynthesis/type III secretory pathway chaperone